MAQQPQHPNSASSASARPATSSARASGRGERSWFDDVRPARRVQASSPETRIPVSETAISQADGEA